MSSDSVDYRTVTSVHRSWDRLKFYRNHEVVVGELLLVKLQEQESFDSSVFRRSSSRDERDRDRDRDRSFDERRDRSASPSRRSVSPGRRNGGGVGAFDAEDARAVYDLINEAVVIFGPDVDDLKGSLILLGQRKGGFGVDPEAVAPLGRAVLAVLEELLGSSRGNTTSNLLFTEDDREAWKIFLRLFCTYLRMGINQSRNGGGGGGSSSAPLIQSPPRRTVRSFSGSPAQSRSFSPSNSGVARGAPLAASFFG